MEAAQKVPSLDELELFDSCSTLGSGVCTGVSEWITADNAIDLLDKAGALPDNLKKHLS